MPRARWALKISGGTWDHSAVHLKLIQNNIDHKL